MGTTIKTISYQYDATGKRSLMIDPNGGLTTYTYNSLNRINSLTNPQGERTTYIYNANGLQTFKYLANGSRTSFLYDANSRLTRISNLKSDDSFISQFDYKYDNVGNRLVSVEADNSRVTWTYDEAYQLTEENRTGISPYHNLFSYDVTGNRVINNQNGVRTTFSFDEANQLKTSFEPTGITTYSYDADGNQRLIETPTGSRTTMLWDFENRIALVELPAGIRNTISYEPGGLRVKLEESTGTRKFIWDNQNYLAEADVNNDIQSIYTNSPAKYGKLISQRRNSITAYYLYDSSDSTRELINSSETVTDTHLYDAWGNLIASTGSTINPFRWTGKVGYYWNEETENYYIRARTYQPTIGRWLSTDPLMFVDGVNLYLAYFVPNNIDPSGLQASGHPPGTVIVTTPGGGTKVFPPGTSQIVIDLYIKGHPGSAVITVGPDGKIPVPPEVGPFMPPPAPPRKPGFCEICVDGKIVPNKELIEKHTKAFDACIKAVQKQRDQALIDAEKIYRERSELYAIEADKLEKECESYPSVEAEFACKRLIWTSETLHQTTIFALYEGKRASIYVAAAAGLLECFEQSPCTEIF